jgi:hypothetical protein
MKCVNHSETDSVGMCLSCAKPVCSACEVKIGGETYCKECSAKKASCQSSQQKSPGLASILSAIIGGAGQIYNGQIGKGLLIFFTSWLILPWIYGIYDAYKVAEKINSGEISFPNRPGCTIAAIVLMIAVPFVIIVFAIMLAIAIPAFIMARSNADYIICTNNMRYIGQVKDLYANDNGLTRGAVIVSIDNNGIDDGDGIPDVLESYFEKSPKCPSDGQYNIGAIGEKPQCSIGDKGTTSINDDHILRQDKTGTNM